MRIIRIFAVTCLLSMCLATFCYAVSYTRLNMMPEVSYGNVAVTSIGRELRPEQGSILNEVNVDLHEVKITDNGVVRYKPTYDNAYGWNLSEQYFQVDVTINDSLVPAFSKNAFVKITGRDNVSYTVGLYKNRGVSLTVVNNGAITRYFVNYNIQPYFNYRVCMGGVRGGVMSVTVKKLATNNTIFEKNIDQPNFYDYYLFDLSVGSNFGLVSVFRNEKITIVN